MDRVGGILDKHLRWPGGIGGEIGGVLLGLIFAILMAIELSQYPGLLWRGSFWEVIRIMVDHYGN